MMGIGRKTIGSLGLSGILLMTAGCASTNVTSSKPTDAAKSVSTSGPNLYLRNVKESEKEDINRWINDGIEMIQSDRFLNNLSQASGAFSQTWLSKERGIKTPREIAQMLKLSKEEIPSINWATTSVNLQGKAKRENTPIGYNDRTKNTRATVGTVRGGGKMTFGRVHLDRFINGDTVEKSCALNTMTHEISHTLSDAFNRLDWIIIDREGKTDRPDTMIKASYLIGVVAQCTFLQDVGRVQVDGIDDCMKTFADPVLKSQFQTNACDDFPGQEAVKPAGRNYIPRRWDQ